MKIEIIQNKIYEIRGEKVMLDFDIAQMTSQFVISSDLELEMNNNKSSQFVMMERGRTVAKIKVGKRERIGFKK